MSPVNVEREGSVVFCSVYYTRIPTASMLDGQVLVTYTYILSYLRVMLRLEGLLFEPILR
jgi:hypothetical protein